MGINILQHRGSHKAHKLQPDPETVSQFNEEFKKYIHTNTRIWFYS